MTLTEVTERGIWLKGLMGDLRIAQENMIIFFLIV